MERFELESLSNDRETTDNDTGAQNTNLPLVHTEKVTPSDQTSTVLEQPKPDYEPVRVSAFGSDIYGNFASKVAKRKRRFRYNMTLGKA